jgi:hypothetical protein
VIGRKELWKKWVRKIKIQITLLGIFDMPRNIATF